MSAPNSPHTWKSLVARIVAVALVGVGLPLLVGPAGPAQATGEKWYDGANRNSPDIVNCIVWNPGPGMAGRVGYYGNLNSATPTPSVGAPFYLHVVVAAVGNPCSGQFAWVDLRLPSGVTPSVSGSAPVRCFVDAVEAPGECSQQVLASADTPGGWNVGSARGDRLFLMPFGKTLEIAVPVTSSRPVLGEQMSARINAIDGTPNWFEPSAPLTVTGGSSPSAPSIFYPVPSTEVRGTGDYLSTAYLNSNVGGTVTFQIGTTTAYGLFTDTSELPQPGTWTATTDWRPAVGVAPNLALGTTYHWRMGFTPTSGPTVWGIDQTFRTPGVAGFRVVGDGTATSCTGAALASAIPGPNVKARIEFDCGAAPVSITMATSYIFGDWTELVIDGGDRVTLRAAAGRRHFSPQANSTITLRNLTLTGGTTTAEALACGGSLRVGPYGVLTLDNVTIRSSTSVDGGGLCVDEAAQATVRNSVISGNTATRNGGGIFNLGTLSVTGGEVNGNAAVRGGGIHTGGPVTDPASPSRSASLANLAIVGNTATSSSGGVYSHADGDFAMVSSTVSGNRATGTNAAIGGIAVVGTGYIVASTIANNTAKYPLNAAGLSASNQTQMGNTVLAGNLIDQPDPTADTLANCTPTASGRVSGLGGNIESGASCGFIGAGNLSNANPQLQPLANNGGSSRTHAVPPGSVLVDAVPTLNEIYVGSTDQRGVGNQTTGQRALDGNGSGGAQSDVGAFELQPESVSPKAQGLVASGPNPVTAESAQWTATFSEPVLGVDIADFVAAATGLSGAAVQSVSPAGGPATTYTVTLAAGTGDGTLRVDLVDDDSIRDVFGNRLGGSGLGDGAITGGTVTVARGPVSPPPVSPPPVSPPPVSPPPVTPPPVTPLPVTPPAPADSPTPAPAPAPGASAVTEPAAVSLPTATATVKAVKSRSYLYVDVAPNKGAGYWKLQVERERADGSWQPLKSYRTKGSKETRTINLPRGTYRVVVLAKYGFQGSTSAEVYVRK